MNGITVQDLNKLTKESFEAGYLKCLLDVTNIIGLGNLTDDQMALMDHAKNKAWDEHNNIMATK